MVADLPQVMQRLDTLMAVHSNPLAALHSDYTRAGPAERELMFFAIATSLLAARAIGSTPETST